MTVGQPGQGWGVVLRRQPARIIDGRPGGGYTDAFEIICCHCGDDPALDYREVSRRLQLVRGPYQIAVGVAAYEEHIGWHERTAGETCSGPARRVSSGSPAWPNSFTFC